MSDPLAIGFFAAAAAFCTGYVVGVIVAIPGTAETAPGPGGGGGAFLTVTKPGDPTRRVRHPAACGRCGMEGIYTGPYSPVSVPYAPCPSKCGGWIKIDTDTHLPEEKSDA